MAKAPVAGQVKTRLIPALGKHQSVRIYKSLLAMTVSRIAGSDQYAHEISCSPDIQHAFFRLVSRRYQSMLRRQPRGDLGQRMSRIFNEGLKNHSSVIIIGSDLVNIDVGYIQQALAHLEQPHAVVLGTTTDGGYGLIGLSQHAPRLFQQIPWSTPQVAAITRRRARQINRVIYEIPGLQDIDTYTDYCRYRSAIALQR